MAQQYVIRDESIKFDKPANPLETSLFYASSGRWVKTFEQATKFDAISAAVEIARELRAELPVKLLVVEVNGHQIGVGEVAF